MSTSTDRPIRAAIYARVSTGHQGHALQLAAVGTMSLLFLVFLGCQEEDYRCMGKATACSRFDENCSEQEGREIGGECLWVQADAGAPCSDYDEEECDNFYCEWREGCVGEPDECSDYARKKNCEKQDGCWWQIMKGL